MATLFEFLTVTFFPITFEDGFRSTSNYPQKKARPFAELAKKTAWKTNVIFLAAVGLFWTPLRFVLIRKCRPSWIL